MDLTTQLALSFSLMIINKDVKSHVCCVSFFNKNIVITIINFFYV